MQIIREITMHLDRREATPVVDVVQGETARWLTVALYEKGQPWIIPQDATIMIRYRKPDCTGGVYDSYPDGTRAWNIRDNVVEFRIAPQALAVAGVTAMQIAVDAQGEELASFIFHLRVESDPSIGTRASDDYINIGQWLMPRIYQFVSEAEAAAALAVRAADDAARTAAGVSSRYLPAYFMGCIDPVEGFPAESDTAIASDHFPLLGGTLGVAFPEVVTVRLYYYDQALRFLGADLTRTESFELDAPVGAAFARAEIRYAAGMTVEDVAALSKYVTLYIPNSSAEDAQRAEDAAGQAFLSADRANTAAQLALDATKNCVKTINGISPDENGNVSVAGGSAEPMKYLQLDRRKLQGYDMLALYNGTEFKQAEIPMGFTCIEPSEYNGQSNILRHHLSNMPAMLCGTFKATEQSEEEYHFQYAYAFSGGYADYEPSACVVLEPESGKIWHFDFADDSIKTTTIGESGGTMQPLTFTGAVEATYDGTEPISVEIPIPTGGGAAKIIADITTTEEVYSITQSFDIAKNADVRFFWYVPPSDTASQGTFVIGNKTIYSKDYTSNLSNSGLGIIEWFKRKSPDVNMVHAVVYGAGKSSEHFSGRYHIAYASSATMTITDTPFPVGTRLIITATEFEG